ncbi:DMP19 family protein [Spongiimicrobium sp. 3-5]|uniref:DMP19 family protein n=1 Tax=Spongiimicrobium sp. 3-5 TaxID=3332596 RepID=UPI00397FD20C
MEKILEMDREDMIVMEIDSYLNEKSKYGEEMEKLNSSQRVLVIVENLEREINNGGFHQFYWNSSGDYANETVDVLIKIGAKKTAEIVKSANSEFPNGQVPKERDKRGEILDMITERASDNWNTLNFKFYGPNEQTGEIEIDDIPSLLIEFINANKSDFQK